MTDIQKSAFSRHFCQKGLDLTLPQVGFLLSSEKCGGGGILAPLREMPPGAPKMAIFDKMFILC